MRVEFSFVSHSEMYESSDREGGDGLAANYFDSDSRIHNC
jgi:hypothetical protein